MKKHLALACAGIIMSAASFAQISLSDFSAGISGDYTMYKGDLQRSAPGVKVEVNYGLYERLGFTVGFTKGFAITEPSTISVRNNAGERRSIDSELRLKFSTVSIATHYRLVGNSESNFQGYIPVGASLVFAKVEEKAKQDVPSGYTAEDQMETEKINGFTLNLGVGAQYTIGTPVIFAEAGIRLPANQVQNAYVQNPIPAHFNFNVGVRFPFGSRE
ncbi:outer membrane beta-barrel protein [Aridibaculum aurantiacum]|uniref:outer membrane beta-barrel protein n=1 Tax=Aridibaculum aurantiacum TaxID=2810307 RepID=UPI001A9651A0|nr:outer membrane beta-barrel protein [Aridibaculum aurantiacum]